MAAGAQMWQSEVFTQEKMVAWENKPAESQMWAHLCFSAVLPVQVLVQSALCHLGSNVLKLGALVSLGALMRTVQWEPERSHVDCQLWSWTIAV